MYYKYLADEHGRSKSGNLKYLDELKRIARQYRNNPTKAEQIFWDEVLQYNKIKYRFLRQKPINRYILDFYCSKLMLAIEIDGDSHKTKEYLDTQRDLFLEKYHIKTIRYTNDQVLNELNDTRNDLNNIINEREKLIFSSPFVKGESPVGEGDLKLIKNNPDFLREETGVDFSLDFNFSSRRGG